MVLALISGTAEGDAVKARKKLDDDYVPVTTSELALRVTRSDLKIVALLIEAGVDVNAADDDGVVPLHAVGHATPLSRPEDGWTRWTPQAIHHCAAPFTPAFRSMPYGC